MTALQAHTSVVYSANVGDSMLVAALVTVPFAARLCLQMTVRLACGSTVQRVVEVSYDEIDDLDAMLNEELSAAIATVGEFARGDLGDLAVSARPE